MQSKEPVFWETPNDMVKTQLLQYYATDNSLYRGLGGHIKLKLKDVFNFQKTDNPHRIEELPEDVEGEVARDIPSHILQSMVPSHRPSLLLWKETLRVSTVLSKQAMRRPAERNTCEYRIGPMCVMDIHHRSNVCHGMQH
jgi:hypothetical protein